MTTMRFWILQWPSERVYYARDKVDGWDSIGSTLDPMLAVRFESIEAARRFHDAMGHFYHQEMKAVGIHVVVATAGSVTLKARRTSTHEDVR